MIPIDFLLNFSINSNEISRTFSKTSKGLSEMSESVADISNSLMTNFYAGIPELPQILVPIQKSIENTFGAINETAFGQLMQKNALRELENGMTNISNIMSSGWIDGFDMMDNDANELRKTLTEMKLDPKNAKTFDSLQDHLKKMNEYSKSLSAKQLKPFVDQMEQLTKKQTQEGVENFVKEFDKLSKSVESIEKRKEFGKTLLDPFTKLKGIIEGYASQIIYAIGLYEVLTDSARAHTTAAQSIAKYGVGSMGDYGSAVNRVRGHMNAFNEETLRVGRETQVSLTEASQAMSELARLRLSRNIDELGALGQTSIEMSKAFGVSTSDAADFARSIIQIGGMGQKEFRAAGDALAQVQQEMGLTENATRATMNQVGVMMRQFRMFGARSSDVGKVTREVARLASAFEVVGLSADSASQLLSKMLDPTQINDNVLLWQGLGMSVADGMAMMAGDTSKMTGMTERMRDLAKNLKAQYGGNVIALQQMAAAYGLNMEQVAALSSLTDEQISQQKEETKLQDAALAARQGLNDQLQRMWGSLNIILQQTVLPLLTFLSKGLEGVAKFMKGVSDFGEKTHPALRFFIRALKTIATIMGVSIAANIFKIIPMIGSVTKGLGNAVKETWELAKGVGRFMKELIMGEKKGLFNKIGDAFAKFKKPGAVPATAPQAPGAVDNINKTKPEQVSKLGQAFKAFPSPSQILAVAVAIVALGIAIGAIILSIAVLANTMKEFDLGQMIVFFTGVAAILIIVMWGMVSAIGALGAISAVAAGPLLAAAVAIFAIGAAVAVVMLSLAVFTNSIANLINSFREFFSMLLSSDKSLGQIITVFAGIAAGLVMLGYAALATTIPLLAFGLAAATVAIPLFILGSALMMIGAGSQLMKGLVDIFAGLAISAPILAAAMMTLVPSMASFAGLSVPFALALASLAPGIAILFLLGQASTKVAQNMTMLGSGLQSVTDNAALAMVQLSNLMNMFQQDQIVALEDFASRFAQQIQKIAASITALQVSVVVSGVGGFISGLLGKISGASEGGGATSQDNTMKPVVDQLVQSNKHLNAIENNTDESIVLMKRLISQNRRVEMAVNIGR